MAATPITLNLKTRIALTVLLLFLGCIWLLTYLATTQLKQEFGAVLADQQFSYVSQTSVGIEGQIHARFEALDVVAKEITPAVLADRSKLHALLVSHPLLLSYFGAGVAAVSREGVGLADFPMAPNRVGAPFSELEYFQEVMATGKPTLGKARIGRFTKALGVAFAVPIRDANLKTMGVLVGFATLSDNALFANIINVKIGKSGWIAVSDARYRMIIAINDPKRLLQPFPKPGVNVMLDRYAAGEEGSGVSINSQGREVLSSAKQIGKTGWFVQSVLPTDEAYEPIRKMISRIYVIAAVLSLLATLLVWIVIRKLLGPLSAASADIRRMATGDDELAELPVPRQDEIGELLNTFNMLFKQRRTMERVLRESESRLRAIIENEPECIKVLDPQGCLVQMNAAGLAMIEADAEAQVVGHNIADLVAPAQRQAFVDLCRRVNQGESGTLEFEVIGLKGGRRWLDTHAVPMLDAENQIVGLLAVTRDITAHRAAEAALRESEQMLREAQSIAQLGSWELDLTSNAMTWSEEVFRIFEIDALKFGASHDAFLAAIHPDDGERVNQAFAASLQNRLPFEVTHRLLLPDGTIKYVREHGKTTYAADGKPLRSTGTVQDVTLSVLNEESLRESEERFRTIADYTYDWEYWQGPQGEFLYISPSCERVTGYAQADFISKPNLLIDIVHPDDRHLMEEHIEEIGHQDVCSLDFRIVHRDGDIRWIAHGCRAVYAKDGRFLGRRASNRDITDRKAAEEQVQQLAYFDTLTGLPNRRMLHDRLDRALLQAKRFGRSLAIMFLDLDNFKKINDTLGHDVGDELLKEVAVRLKTCVRSGDTVARQGGDEFIIVLAEVAESRDAALVAEKIVAVLGGDPVRIGDQSLDVTTSIGIAVYPINGTDDVQELLKKADKAMYAAKASGRNGYRFFEA